MESLRNMYFLANTSVLRVKGIFRAPTRLSLRVKSKMMELSESIFSNGLIFLKIVIPKFGGKSIEGNHINFQFSHIFNPILPHLLAEKKLCF